jgi:septum formation protein
VDPQPLLVLASASPRRAHILRALGIPFRVRVSEIEESFAPGEAPEAAALRLAREKALAVAAFERLPVLAADTLVVCDGRALGKPASPTEARAMLALLSGRTHEVVTGVCLVAAGTARDGLARTKVAFAPLSAGEIAWYVASGEPLDKAGAYHVDGRGALFVEWIEGSASNVAGLPVRLVLDLARAAGIALGPP